MFMGQYSHSLDEKGRLIIPSRFREELGREFVVAKGYDECLYAYNNEEWEKFAESVMELPETRKVNRDKRRYFLSTASQVEMDRQGRALIPGYLRDAVGIDKDIVITGVGNKLEIWSRSKWDEVTGSDAMAKIAAELYDSGDDDSADER